MKAVLSCEQMRAFDRHAITSWGIPGNLLMENAGRGAAEFIQTELLPGCTGVQVVMVIGSGNNGGDGLVVARHLLCSGVHVRVFAIGERARRSKELLEQCAIWLSLGGKIHEIDEEDGILELEKALENADVVVDALFGIGLSRPIAGRSSQVIRAINCARGVRVSLDLPSGLDGDQGDVLGDAVCADWTLTFGCLKLGLLTSSGAVRAGQVRLLSLGVPQPPPFLRVGAYLPEPSDICAQLSPRSLNVYKGRAGRVVIVGGSEGKVGAVLLAARAALRSGAGTVTIASWPEVVGAVEGKLPEAMTFSLKRDRLVDQVDEIIEGKRVVVIGPGFGFDEGSKRVFFHISTSFKGLCVVDADAITLLSHAYEQYVDQSIAGPRIFTPHSGEAARLLKASGNAAFASSTQVEADRYAAIRELIAATRGVVILKGLYSLIGEWGRPLVVNPTGNPLLATPGSGDVLTGVLAALGCALPPFEAAYCATYLHGLAGDCAIDRFGDRGLLASEVADYIPSVISQLCSRGFHRTSSR
ncbi:bifunctional ADP-dependent NAD(P)H-hydrate dehydratase/NAD(P)H-hydrate epimerase [Pajaroellobacter abortibovis]|uniref:Bifunctional NAD(P)H-hydrate repair enzyme n=1 Tax=Pajaroellobacter abortibovis TaxID=1882918 RepID=A0A1L6MVF9_9BACT|nr:bifunctional ADP-dependent NAD(P)H-hydrate dehydratase/NAD(P)H-hydrate epimerase [Pajaroellobacter abortibovis]APR99506.1 hypothetical protein BCY86_01515 [Pajaroellobacter abortibovis]